MLTLKIIGFAFVALMAVCWIRPSFRHLFQETPPAIVRWAYSLITIYGLFLGLRVMFLKELEGSIQQYLEDIFLPGISAGRTPLVLAAVFISLFFVLANLTRSYYNLHRIEDEHETSSLRTLISTLALRPKIIEVLVRSAMFVTIALITRAIASIDRETPNSGSLLGIEAFRIQFDSFWHLTRNYYILLILWDAVIWHANRFQPTGELKTGISKLLWLQAVPVHVAGLTVTLMMCLPRHIQTLKDYADLCSMGALIAAGAGSVMLIVSAIVELPTILETFKLKRTAPVPETATAAESQA